MGSIADFICCAMEISSGCSRSFYYYVYSHCFVVNKLGYNTSLPLQYFVVYILFYLSIYIIYVPSASPTGSMAPFIWRAMEISSGCGRIFSLLLILALLHRIKLVISINIYIYIIYIYRRPLPLAPLRSSSVARWKHAAESFYQYIYCPLLRCIKLELSIHIYHIYIPSASPIGSMAPFIWRAMEISSDCGRIFSLLHILPLFVA